MLTQSDIVALTPQITAKLSTMDADISALTSLVSTSTDYASDEYISAQKKLRALETRQEGLKKLEKVIANYLDDQQILSGGTSDPELISLATEEVKTLLPEIQKLYDAHLSENSKFQNVIMELRAGAGGEEAALFSQEIFRMYSQFGVEQGWKVELTDSEVSEKAVFAMRTCISKVKMRISGCSTKVAFTEYNEFLLRKVRAEFTHPP